MAAAHCQCLHWCTHARGRAGSLLAVKALQDGTQRYTPWLSAACLLLNPACLAELVREPGGVTATVLRKEEEQ